MAHVIATSLPSGGTLPISIETDRQAMKEKKNGVKRLAGAHHLVLARPSSQGKIYSFCPLRSSTLLAVGSTHSGIIGRWIYFVTPNELCVLTIDCYTCWVAAHVTMRPMYE